MTSCLTEIKVYHLSQSAGDAALHIATIRNNYSVVEALVDLKADLEITNKVMLSSKVNPYSNIYLVTAPGWLDCTDGGN